MTLGHVDLSFLTNEEKAKITEVLQRDEQIRELELKRVRNLREEVKNLRLKGTIREGNSITRACARCRQSFGMIFNTGSICPKCQFKVCKKCQEMLASGKWICVFCFSQMEYEAKSGNWFYTKYPRTMRDRSSNEVVSGAKIVKDAITEANAGKSLKTVSAFQMNSSPAPMNRPVGSAGAVPLVQQLRTDALVLSPVPQKQQVQPQEVHASQVTPVASDKLMTVPTISVVTIDHEPVQASSHTDNQDAQSLKSMDEFDSGIQQQETSSPSPPSNLSRLSAMTGSTESVMSYYSCAGEANFGKIAVTGEIQFGLTYNEKTGNLEISIRRCRDLAAADAKKNRSDPYVKCYLLPDKSRSGKRKTHCKKNTLNPIFDEVLKYNVRRSEIEAKTLSVMVWNNDRFGRNDFLGEVDLPLTLSVLQDTAFKWYKLSNRVSSPLSSLAYKGDLDVSLKYDNAKRVGGKVVSVSEKGELQVLVKQARNLTALRSSDASDPFCQAFLVPTRSKHDKQKSAVVKHTCNPVWNHTFVFEGVTEDQLRESCVEVTVWDYDRLTSHEFLGGIRFNLGTGRSNGREVDWMDAKGDELTLWQAMMHRPNAWIDGTLLLRVHMTPRK